MMISMAHSSKVDYKKLQEMGGFKTAASATAVYCSTKKKLFGSSDAGEGKKGGKSRKASDTEDAGIENATTDEESTIKAKQSPEPGREASKASKKRKRASKASTQPMEEPEASTENNSNYMAIFVKPEPFDDQGSVDLLASAAQFLENEQSNVEWED